MIFDTSLPGASHHNTTQHIYTMPNINPGKPKRQPMKINHKGVHYTLHTKFKWIDEERGICIGPLYRMEKHD
jgi:hypothetical protein